MGGGNVQLGLALGAEKVAVLVTAVVAVVVVGIDAFLWWSHMGHEGNYDLSVVLMKWAQGRWAHLHGGSQDPADCVDPCWGWILPGYGDFGEERRNGRRERH